MKHNIQGKMSENTTLVNQVRPPQLYAQFCSGALLKQSDYYFICPVAQKSHTVPLWEFNFQTNQFTKMDLAMLERERGGCV